MRKFTSMFMLMMVAVIALVACQKDKGGADSTSDANQENFKVGMMIDSGTIDDKSFNQGTWEGIKAYTKDHKGVKGQHVQPNGETTADYLSAADNLMMAGNNVIVAPGYKFEEAITELQVANPDVSFVILEESHNRLGKIHCLFSLLSKKLDFYQELLQRYNLKQVKLDLLVECKSLRLNVLVGDM